MGIPEEDFSAVACTTGSTTWPFDSNQIKDVLSSIMKIAEDFSRKWRRSKALNIKSLECSQKTFNAIGAYFPDSFIFSSRFDGLNIIIDEKLPYGSYHIHYQDGTSELVLPDGTIFSLEKPDENQRPGGVVFTDCEFQSGAASHQDTNCYGIADSDSAMPVRKPGVLPLDLQSMELPGMFSPGEPGFGVEPPSWEDDGKRNPDLEFGSGLKIKFRHFYRPGIF